MTRPEWLASLKVGDSVGISHRYQGKTIATVAAITPTRRMTVNLGPGRATVMFDANGNQYPRVRSMDNPFTIGEPNAAFRATMTRLAEDAKMRALLKELDAFRYAHTPAGFDYATHNAALQAVLDALRSKP